MALVIPPLRSTNSLPYWYYTIIVLWGRGGYLVKVSKGPSALWVWVNKILYCDHHEFVFFKRFLTH